jgi:hypothetical protein
MGGQLRSHGDVMVDTRDLTWPDVVHEVKCAPIGEPMTARLAEFVLPAVLTSSTFRACFTRP